MSKRAAIILNGIVTNIFPSDIVIAADGGYEKALRLGITANVVIGDFDSYEKIPSKETERITYPKEKDYTDGELAIRLAIEKGYTDLILYGATGGRYDHIFYNFGLLKIAKLYGAEKCCIEAGDFEAFLAEKDFRLKVKANDVISLAPIFGMAHIISTGGLRYPIANEAVDFSSTKYISNYATSEEISLFVEGELVLIHYRA